MGIDPAPAIGKRSDDGALVILRARPRYKGGLDEPLILSDADGQIKVLTNNLSDWLPEFVWAYRLRGASAREWSGLIHAKHQQFHLDGICMDWNGGGTFVMQELNKSRQIINGIERDVTPIARIGDSSVVNAHFILTMFKRGESGIDRLWPILKGDDNLVHAMHVSFQSAVEHAGICLPVPFNERPRETTQDWDIERQWALKNLDEGRRQLASIQVAMQDDGTWSLTRNGAFQYSAPGKKDLAYAMIYAYVKFLIWLSGDEGEFTQRAEDAQGMSIMA